VPASLNLIPEAGPHAVGLRVIQQYDYSRLLEPSVDAFGKAGNIWARARRPQKSWSARTCSARVTSTR